MELLGVISYNYPQKDHKRSIFSGIMQQRDKIKVLYCEGHRMKRFGIIIIQTRGTRQNDGSGPPSVKTRRCSVTFTIKLKSEYAILQFQENRYVQWRRVMASVEFYTCIYATPGLWFDSFCLHAGVTPLMDILFQQMETSQIHIATAFPISF